MARRLMGWRMRRWTRWTVTQRCEWRWLQLLRRKAGDIGRQNLSHSSGAKAKDLRPQQAGMLPHLHCDHRGPPE